MENSREGPRGPGSWAKGSAFTLGANGKPVIDLMGDFRVGRMPQRLLNGYAAGRPVRGPSPPLLRAQIWGLTGGPRSTLLHTYRH